MPKKRMDPKTLSWRLLMGRHILAARGRKGWTQADLAERVGVGTSSVSAWENGQDAPSLDNLMSVAEATGQSVSFLVAEKMRSKRESLEWAALELGVALGHRRVQALLRMPQARLRKEIDAILGAFLTESEDSSPSRERRAE